MVEFPALKGGTAEQVCILNIVRLRKLIKIISGPDRSQKKLGGRVEGRS